MFRKIQNIRIFYSRIILYYNLNDLRCMQLQEYNTEN